MQATALEHAGALKNASSSQNKGRLKGNGDANDANRSYLLGRAAEVEKLTHNSQAVKTTSNASSNLRPGSPHQLANIETLEPGTINLRIGNNGVITGTSGIKGVGGLISLIVDMSGVVTGNIYWPHGLSSLAENMVVDSRPRGKTQYLYHVKEVLTDNRRINHSHARRDPIDHLFQAHAHRLRLLGSYMQAILCDASGCAWDG